MATSLDLPTKRAIEEVGSGFEASKKAKVGCGDDYYDDEYWELSSFEEFEEFCDRSDEIRDRYGHTSDKLIYEWNAYLRKLQAKCKLREIQLFLKLNGREKHADELQSMGEELAYEVEFCRDFQRKGWLLRAIPGPYTDYQRLYVAEAYHYENGELYADFSHLYCTYASDLAFQKFVKELRSYITWDLSWSDAQKIGEDASKKYEDLDPGIVDYATEQAHRLNREEEERKEMVPFFTKLWLEVVRKERDAMEVLNEIKIGDAASFPASINSIKDQLRREARRENLPCLRILRNIKRYIDASNKGGYLDENGIKELIHNYFEVEKPRVALLSAYADYLEKKLPVAASLGLTTC